MRLLIGARDASQVFYWGEFGRTLSKFGVECRVINNIDVVDGFPTKKIHRWGGNKFPRRFNRLINDFNPDVILTDGLRHFGIATIKSEIPLIMNLSGDFWVEMQYAKATQYRSFFRKIAIERLEHMGNEIIRNSKIIMPISKYLDGIIHEKFPNKSTYVLGRMMIPSMWYPEAGMSLLHPCVGMVQNATIWGKAKEMLVLKDVLEWLPNVTFYWAGRGPYIQEILQELKKYPNFKWLGALDYPNGVRKFFSEVDVYALLTGLDMSPTSLKEAMLMEMPAIATNVGGIPEIMEDGKSGFLVEEGDSDGIIEKITYLLENEQIAKQMGLYGRRLIEKSFSGNYIAKGFVENVKIDLGLD